MKNSGLYWLTKTRKLAVCDCETDPFKEGREVRPFLWGYYDGEQYLQFSTTASFLEFAKREKATIFAHNGGRFDFIFLGDDIPPYQPLTIISGRLAKFRIGRAEFRDSWCILPVPLGAYQKDEIDYGIFEEGEREKPENWNKIATYLESDCRYLYDLVRSFIEEYGVSLTLAGRAFEIWKGICELSGQPFEHCSKAHSDLFRPYYYGGRVQCFAGGIIEKNFSVFDINSAYPRAMLDRHPFGEGLVVSTEAALLRDGRKEPGAFFVTLEAIGAGAFPFRDSNGSLVFPDDKERREYHVSGWEFFAWLDTVGDLSRARVKRVWRALALRDFTLYIDRFYKARLKAKAAGDKKGDIFNKILLNALYGKHGANPDEYEDYMLFPEWCKSMLNIHDEGERNAALDAHAHEIGLEKDLTGFSLSAELGDVVLAARDSSRKVYYNVATAASITGWVRAYLWRTIHAIRKAGGEVLYCDTDSVAATLMPPEWIDAATLGKWKWEGDFSKAAIAGKKLYAFFGDGEPKTASKGAKLSAEQIQTIAAGGLINYTFDAPSMSIKTRQRKLTRKIVKRV